METNKATENEKMTICSSCGNSVSVNATTCPRCGNNELKKTEILSKNDSGQTKKELGKVLLYVLILFIVLSVLRIGTLWSVIICVIVCIKSLPDIFKSKGVCPHCNKEITFSENENTVKCNACGKESVITEKYLIGK